MTAVVVAAAAGAGYDCDIHAVHSPIIIVPVPQVMLHHLTDLFFVFVSYLVVVVWMVAVAVLLFDFNILFLL